MEAICYRFPVRPGKSAELEAFFKGTEGRWPETVAALRAAGLTSHAVVVVPTSERDYLLIFSEGPDVSRAAVERMKSDRPIDRELFDILSRTVIIEEGVSLDVLARWHQTAPEGSAG